MKQRFLVEGMSCAACSASVEKAVRRLEFVKQADVNLLAKSMICEFDGSSENTEKIIKAVEKAGFSAKVWENTAKNEVPAENKEENTNSEMAARLIISAVLCVLLMYAAMGHMLNLPFTHWLSKSEHTVFGGILQLLLTIPVLVLNRSFFIRGFKALFKGRANMDSLVAIGSAASVIYSLYALLHASLALGYGDLSTVADMQASFYFDSAAMILTLVTVGKALEERSKKKTGAALSKLTQLAPKFVACIRNAEQVEIPLEELRTGDLFLVRPGERIAADGVIIEGSATIDESALTGESMPAEKNIGDKVLTACTNLNGALTVKAEQVGKETTLSHIIELVETAGASKAPASRLADKVSGIFVPVVIGLAIITFIIWLLAGQTFGFALARAVSVLVISCPCALGLATPVAMTVSMGSSASRGILIKNAETIELLHKADTVIFDKTGTLTKGSPNVTDIEYINSKEDLLTLAYSLESKSEHPLAKAVTEYCEKESIKADEVKDFHAVSGSGVEGYINSELCLAGTASFLNKNGISCEALLSKAEELQYQGKTVLYFAKGGLLKGLIAVSDAIREESREAVALLKRRRIRTILLTGDNKIAAEAVGKEVGVDEIISQVLPADKESIVKKEQQAGRRVIMVGDGINDSPALSRADIGCAMGNGTEIAMESADIILLHNNPCDIPEQIAYSKRTMRNIKQNLFWAFFYNALGIPIAAGALYPAFNIVLNPMIGAIAMSFSSLFVVTNALRLYKKEVNKNDTKN